MSKYIIKTEKDTEKLAKKLAGQFKGWEIIGLIGNLGAGKTTFTQYLAKELGVKDIVNSPTFNIIKIYDIKKSNIKQLIHIDAYRLNSPEELEVLGVNEYFEDKNTITIIEWADKVKNILPKNTIIINIKLNKKRERIFEIN
jgi:tRNA threonylcarbamoyladenosine biosynthesis protein TsaE